METTTNTLRGRRGRRRERVPDRSREGLLFDMMEGRTNEESGANYPIVRDMVQKEPVPAQLSYGVIGTSPTNMLTPVGRFDLREALGFRYDPEELDEMFGTAA